MLFIPFMGVLAVALLAIAYHLVRHDSLSWFATWRPQLAYDFSAYNRSVLLIPATILGTLIVWIVTVRLIRVSALARKLQRNYRLLTLMLVVGFGVAIFSEVKTGAETLFLMAPLCFSFYSDCNRHWQLQKLKWFKQKLRKFSNSLPLQKYKTIEPFLFIGNRKNLRYDVQRKSK